MKEIINASLLSLLSAVSKLLTILIMNKAIAIYAGPSGYAIIGQLQNFMTFVNGVIIGTTNTGIVKYTASIADQQQRISFLASVCKLSIYASLIISLTLVSFSSWFAQLFKLQGYENVIFIFGINYSLFILNNFLISAINGFGIIKDVIKINIFSSVISCFLTIVFLAYFGLHGALISLVVSQSLVVFISLRYFIKIDGIHIRDLYATGVDFSWLPKMSGYICFGFFSILTAPLSMIYVRTVIINEYGLDMAGYWDALTKLSSAYMMTLTMMISVYFLPKLSKLKYYDDLVKELKKGCYFISVLFFIGALILINTREIAIELAFSPSFSYITQFINLLLMTDYLKILSWIFSFYLMSKAAIKPLLYGQVLSAAILIFLSNTFIPNHGLSGFYYSSLCANFSYFIFMLLASAYYLKGTSRNCDSPDGVEDIRLE